MSEPMKRHKKNTHNDRDHEPQEESTRAVFGDPKARQDFEFTPRTFKK